MPALRTLRLATRLLKARRRDFAANFPQVPGLNFLGVGPRFRPRLARFRLRGADAGSREAHRPHVCPNGPAKSPGYLQGDPGYDAPAKDRVWGYALLIESRSDMEAPEDDDEYSLATVTSAAFLH